MKRDAGVAATLAVVLMLFGYSTLQRQGPEGPPATGVNAQAVASPGKETKLESPDVPCQEIAKRLLRFSAGGEVWALPGFCYKSRKQPSWPHPRRLHAGVHFAIATVPNPVSTHLPLMFDRIVESIQQAAQDDGYSYESSWFPWERTGQSFTSLSDRKKAARRRDIRQDQPGVMVFRRDGHRPYDGGLVVFVVGEQPTGGLNDDQFENALSWIGALGSHSPPDALNILGPTFSGTLPSLRRVLQRHLDSLGTAGIHVSSGSVTDGATYEKFRNWINRSPGSYFRTAEENDSLVIERFCRYLHAQGYDLHRVAELSEDETRFGARRPVYHLDSGRSARWNLLTLYYPRDIATLRTAYQQESIFRSAGEEEKAGTPSRELRGDLSEPAGDDRDTLQSYAGSLTPLAQESILLDITNRLDDRHIQFIILRSTNSLDQIFLSEFLRRTYPQGRLVIDGAGLLLSRGSWGGSLRGVMVLSTYPLVTLEQDWTPSLFSSAIDPNRPRGADAEYRSFGQEASEGAYIAARELFSDPQTDPKPPVPIHDYAVPTWAADPKDNGRDNECPATWLTVIGRRRFWPVAALDPYTLKETETRWAFVTDHLKFWLFSLLASSPGKEEDTSILDPSPSRGDGTSTGKGDSRLRPIPLPFWVVVIAWLGWCCVHAWLRATGSITGSPRWRAYFQPVPRWQYPALIAIGSLLLAIFAVVVATDSGWLSWSTGSISFSSHWKTGAILGACLLAGVAIAAWAVYQNCELPGLAGGDTQDKGSSRSRHVAALSAFVVLVLFVLIQAILLRNLSIANRFPAFWRSVNLVSGVSPLLPQLLLIAGMYVWFWCTLRGLAHFGKDRPVLPKENDLPLFDDPPRRSMMPMLSWERAGKVVERPARPLYLKSIRRDVSPAAAKVDRRRARSWRFEVWERLLHPDYVTLLVAFFLAVVPLCRLALGAFSLRTLGELSYGRYIFFWICLCIAVVLADAIQLWRVWSELQQLLVSLGRLPLRRTLRALKGLEWGSIWKMSGNVLEERYRAISLQIECLRHLRNQRVKAQRTGDENSALSCGLAECLDAELPKFAEWYVGLERDKPVQDLKPIQDFQEKLAHTAGLVMKEVLLPEWRQETDSLISQRPALGRKTSEADSKELSASRVDIPPQVQAAEEFVVLQYLAFIQNIFGRLRTMVLGILWLFVGTTLAVASYPFEPVDVLGGIFLVVFVLVGAVIVVVYAQMCRDATLSYITDTTPGQLGWDFWFRLAAFGIGPLAGLLATLFPSISDFVFSWLQPSVQALH